MGLLWDEGMNAKTLGGIPGVQLGFGGMLIQIHQFRDVSYAVHKDIELLHSRCIVENGYQTRYYLIQIPSHLRTKGLSHEAFLAEPL